MAALKILILFLIINCEKRTLCDDFEDDHSWTESDQNSPKTSPDNELTHVRSKTLNGNVKLTTLEVFTTNAPLVGLDNGPDGTVIETSSDSVPNENKQARFPTIIENQQKVVLLSEVGTKVPTDGSERFALMDVFNSTSGTLPDQAPTEKLIIVTPLKPGLIDGNAEKNQAEEAVTENTKSEYFGNEDLETVSVVYPEETADLDINALSRSYVVKTGVFTTAETDLASSFENLSSNQDFATSGNLYNIYQIEKSATATIDSETEKLAQSSEGFEDLSSFMNVDQDLLNTVEGNNTNRMEDLNEAPEDIYSILEEDDDNSNFSLSAEFNRNSDLVAIETKVLHKVKLSELDEKIVTTDEDEFLSLTEDYHETIRNGQNLSIKKTETFDEILTKTRTTEGNEETEKNNVILTTGSDIIATTNPPAISNEDFVVTVNDIEKINTFSTADIDMTVKEFDNDFRTAEDLTKIATETEISKALVKIAISTENDTSTSININGGKILDYPTNCSTENLIFLQETTAPETILATADNKITEIEETNIDGFVTWTQQPINIISVTTAGDLTKIATEAEVETTTELFKILSNTENDAVTSTNETETILANSKNGITAILTDVTNSTEETNLNVTNNDNVDIWTEKAINVIYTVTEDLTQSATESEVQISSELFNTEKDLRTRINIDGSEILDNPIDSSTENLTFLQETTSPDTILATSDNTITEISADVTNSIEETNIDIITTTEDLTKFATEAEVEISTETETILAASENRITETLTDVTNSTEETNLNFSNNDNFDIWTQKAINVIPTVTAEDFPKNATELEVEINTDLFNTEKDTTANINIGGSEILDRSSNFSTEDLKFLQEATATETVLVTAENRITETSTDVTNLDVINIAGVATSTQQPIAAEDLTKFATEAKAEVTSALVKILMNTESSIKNLDTTNFSTEDLQFLGVVPTTESILETAENRISEISTDVTNLTEETSLNVTNFDTTEVQYNNENIAITVSEVSETATQLFSLFNLLLNNKDLVQTVEKIVTAVEYFEELNDESTETADVTENFEIYANVNLVITPETEMLITEASLNIRKVNDILTTTEEILTQTTEFTTQTSFLTTKTISDHYQVMTTEMGEEVMAPDDDDRETILNKENKENDFNEIENNLINNKNVIDQEDIRENTTFLSSQTVKEIIVGNTSKVFEDITEDDKLLVIDNKNETRNINDKDSVEHGETITIKELFTSPLLTTVPTINNDKNYAINNNIVYTSRHINQPTSTEIENTNQMLTSTLALNHLKSAENEEPQFKISLFSDKTEFNSSADEVLTTEEISTMDIQEPQMFVNISGKIVSSSIKIIDNESSFFVPSDALTTFHPPDIVHITWKSSNRSVNNSIELQFGTALQVNIVKGNQMHMHKTENKLEDVDSNLIALGDGVQIYFSNADFYKQDRLIGSEFMTDSSVKTLTGEIVGSCFGFLIIAGIATYYLIRKCKGKTHNFEPNNEA